MLNKIRFHNYQVKTRAQKCNVFLLWCIRLFAKLDKIRMCFLNMYIQKNRKFFKKFCTKNPGNLRGCKNILIFFHFFNFFACVYTLKVAI